MFVAAIWLWPAMFNVVHRFVGTAVFGWDNPSASELLFTFGDWAGYALFTPFIFAVANRWPVVRPHVGRRFAIHLGFALLFCVAWALGGKLLTLGLMSVLEPDRLLAAISAAGNNLERELAKNVFGWLLGTIPFGVVVYATVSAMAHAIGYFTEARDREVQLARLGEQLAGARFAALQAQVNPHFLFNTLNTIAVLVRDGDRTGAVQIVERLSELLRRTLSRHRANEASLADELDLVRQYLAIEEARFSDRLRVTWEIGPGLDRLAVPSFALQHLVENAVRHGVARGEDSGRIRISAVRDGEFVEIRVTDDGPGIAPGFTPMPGHGIATTQERLAALHGDRASLTLSPADGGGTVATLRIPFRELPDEVAGATR